MPVALLLATILVGSLACDNATPLRLATTTSIDHSGLLPRLLASYEARSGTRVDALVVGSGKAMNLLSRGDADLMITHDPGGERRYVETHEVAYYRKIMCADFMLAGPPDDPAGIARSASAVEAFAAIFRHSSPFASRGDQSGTHARELEIWRAAGIDPNAAIRIETGQGMAPTLRISSERGAYVLTDLPTFLQLRDTLDLVALFERIDPALINCYAVTVPSPADPRALELAAWLADGDGRALVEDFTIADHRPFRSWPRNVDGRRPEALPR